MDLSGYKPLFDRDEEARRAASGIPDYSGIKLAKMPEPPGVFKRVDDAITGVLGTNAPPEEKVDPAGVASEAAAAEQQQARIGLRRSQLVDPNRGEVRRKFDAAAGGMAGAVGGAAEWVGRKTGIAALEQFGQSAQEDAAALMPEDATFADKLANALGSTASFLLPGMGVAKVAQGFGLGVRAANLAGAGVASVAETLGNAQQAYEDAMKHTGNSTWAEEQGWKTAITMLPINFLTDKIGLFGRSGVKEAERAAAKAIAGGASKEAAERAAVLAYKAANKPLRDVGVAMGAEAFQEGSQTLAANYFGHNPIGEGVAESAVLGGLVGGIFKGGQKLLEPKVETPPPPPPPAPAPLALPSPDSPMPGAPVTVAADGTAVPMTYREYQEQSATRDLGQPVPQASPDGQTNSTPDTPSSYTPDIPPTPVGIPLEADAAHAVANDARNNGQQTMVLPHPDAPGKFMVVPSTQPATEPPPPQTTIPALPAPTSPFPGGIMRSDAAGGARPETYQEALETREQRQTAESLGTPVITQPGASSEAAGAIPPVPPGAPDVVQPESSVVGVPPHIAHRLAGEARDRGEQVTVQPHPTSPGAFVVQRVDQPAGEAPVYGPERGVNPPKPGPVMPTDKVKADGTPYKTKSGAAVALKAAGLAKTHVVTQVEGGYTLRPLEAKSAAAPGGVQATAATPAWATDYSTHSGVKVGTNTYNHRAIVLYGNVRNLPSYNRTIFPLRDNGETSVVSAAINDLLKLGMPSSMLSNITAIGSHDGGNLAQFNTTSRSISIRSDVLYDVRQGGEAAAIALRSFLAHEFGHAADLMTPNDAISAQELGFGIQPDGNGYLTPGNLSHEIAEHWVNGGEFVTYFDYPLAKSFDSWGLSTELFAQSTALYFTNPDKMADQLPLNFAAMEAIYGTKKGGNAGVRVGSPGGREAIRAALQQESPGRSAEGVQPRRVAGADQRRAQVEQAGRGVGVDVGVGPDDDVALGVEYDSRGLRTDIEAAAGARASDVGHKRTTAGEYVGAPDWVGKSPQNIAALRGKLRKLAVDGTVGRFWYEQSSRSILKFVGGDKVDAERFVALIAIYSPNNAVPGNTTAALLAWYQWKAGVPVRVAMAAADQKANELLYDDKMWKGVKTNSFYQNLMVEIDPSKLDPGNATMDMWMALAFDYGKKTVDQGPQYRFMENEIRRLAHELGWDAHQVQAAIWTGMKGRIDPIRKKLASRELKAGISELVPNRNGRLVPKVKADRKYDHFRLAHKMGMAWEPDPSHFKDAAYDFADALNDRSAQISWEAQPSKDSTKFPELRSAPIAQKAEYAAAIDAAMRDATTGRDMAAEKLGILAAPSELNPSAWEGDVGMGEQQQAPIAFKAGATGTKRAVDERSRQALNLWAAVRGLVLQQDMVCWHFPIFEASKKDQNGVRIVFNGPLSVDDTRVLYKTISDLAGHTLWAPAVRGGEVRILNFSSSTNVEFQGIIDAALKALPERFAGAEVAGFRSDGDAMENDWKEYPNGELYAQALRAAGRSDVLGWATTTLADAVKRVDRKFAKKYGWTLGEDRALGIDSTASEAGGLPDRGPVARSTRPMERERGAIAVDGERLRGAPEGVEVPGRGRVEIRPNLTARQTAANYMAKAGLPYTPPTTFARVDPARAKRIADAFDAMPHAPNDPDVKAAYAAMINETLAQWRAIKKTGLKVEFITGADPYAASPRLAILDVLENNHLWVFPTESGFGVSEADVSSNPLLAPTAEKIDGRVLLANDVFRIVHDYFGHIKDGNGFRADGEENAWRSHSAMYSPLARRAMTTETRGQNSWVNYGPYGAQNRSASGGETHYADQKTGLLPEWVVEEGAGDAPHLNRAPADEALDYGHKGTGENASGIRAMGDIERRYAMGVQPDGRGGYVIQDMRSGGTSEPYKTYDEARVAIPALREAGGVPPRRSFNRVQRLTKAFRDWFGDSKVVDESGEPLIAYHGTNVEIDEFDIGEGTNEIGSWFSAPVRHSWGPATAEARSAADQFAATQTDLYGGADVTYPVYLSIANPREFKGHGAFRRWARGSANGPALRDKLIKQGYDGIVIRDSMTDSGELRDDWVAFSKAQIKSATGNNGKFSKTNPDIRRNQPFLPGQAGPATGNAISRQALQAIVDRVVEKWSGAPRIVIENAPPAGIPSDSVGAYDGRTVTLYAKKLKTDRQALTTLAHEVVGHHSVEEMLGPERFAQLVKAIQTARAAGNKAVLELAQSVRETHGNLDPNEQAAEIVARAAERAVDADGNIRPGFAWFKRMLSHIAEFLRSRGVDVAFTNAELAGLLSRAERRLSEEGGVVTPATAYTNRQSPIFYSALTRALASHPQGRGDAGQWMGIIRSLKGVKPDEVKWSGVEPWLNAQKGPIARQALVDYLNANNVQVMEVELGGGERALVRELAERYAREDGHDWDDLEQEARDEYEYIAASDDSIGRADDATKFQSYTLPGGENYRELLLTLPDGRPEEASLTIAQDFAAADGKNWEDLHDGERSLYLGRAFKQETKGPSFRASHFEQPNILAHIRFDERTDAQGRRVLHIAEIQSDWAQKGRKHGFDKKQEMWVLRSENGQLARRFDVADEAAARELAATDGLRVALEPVTDVEIGVPPAPYVTTQKFGVFVDGKEWVVKSNKPEVADQTPRFGTMLEAEIAAKKVGGEARDLGLMDNTPGWSMLAMRRMIRYASENGFDAVTWDVGATHQDRYDLSKQVDQIAIGSYGAGGYQVVARKSGDVVIDQVADDAAGLEDLIGKDLTSKHLESGRTTNVFKGLDLKVGGEGMLGFYDEILPKEVNKYAKQWGAKVEAGEVAVEEAGETTVERAHSLTITPAMRESAMQGVPLFNRAQRMTSAFKKWFGDSKVVDEKGEPLVVYHGTNRDFSQFKIKGAGVYFAAGPETASVYAKNRRGGNVMPLYLSIKNPLVMTTQELMSGKTDGGILHYLAGRKGLERMGYDGIIALASDPSDPALSTDVYVAFDARQIKSATGNNGNFSSSPDIRLNRAPDWVTSGSPDLQSAAAKIDTYAPGDTIKVKVAKLTQNWKLRLQQGLVDSFAALKDLGDEQYLLARMTKGAIGALEGALLYGIPKLDRNGAIYGELDHKGFLGAMKELNGEHDRFFMWVAGNRANRLMGESKERLWTQPEITAMRALNQDRMKDGSSRQQAYDAALVTLTRYNKAIMDIAEKTGLIDGESRATWEHGFYVPFYRMMEDDRISGPTKVKGLVRQYAFKKLKGGEQSVGDLMANTLQNWSHLLSASLANQAAVSALQKAEQMGVASRATAETKGATFAMEGGQKAYYEVHDPFVLQAISALDQAGFKGIAAEWMTGLKRVLTMGVTVSPTFKIRNLMRDTLSAMAQTNTSYNLLENMRQGFAGTSKKSDDYAQMLFGGGLMRFGTIIEGEHAQHAKRLIKSGIRDQTILDTPTKIRDAMGKVWDAYQDFGDRMENINRAALYKKLRSEGKSHLEAAYQARDMMDFGLQGSWVAMRFLAQTVPFLNARAQGLYKLGRSAKGDPQRFLAVTGAVSLASMMLLLAYADDDDWKQREDWDRDTYWWFKIGETAYRIPKPFEVGAIGTIAERSLELLVNNEFTGKDFAKRMMFMLGQTFAFNPVPQMFKPAIDLYANTDSFTGRDIETRGMEALSKSERIGPNTSLLAQALGSAGDYTGVSPVQIDFLLRAYLGWMGTHAALAADSMAQPFRKGEQPAGKIDDVFLVGDFVKSLPQPQSRYTTEFYDQAKKVSEVMANIRHYRQLGDTDKVRSIIEDNRDKISLSPMYTSTERQLSAIGQMVKKIRANTELSATEKRERLDELAQRRNQLVKGVSQRIRERAAAE